MDRSPRQTSLPQPTLAAPYPQPVLAACWAHVGGSRSAGCGIGLEMSVTKEEGTRGGGDFVLHADNQPIESITMDHTPCVGLSDTSRPGRVSTSGGGK